MEPQLQNAQTLTIIVRNPIAKVMALVFSLFGSVLGLLVAIDNIFVGAGAIVAFLSLSWMMLVNDRKLTLTADRGTGELTCSRRSLFKKAAVTCKISDIVDIQDGISNGTANIEGYFFQLIVKQGFSIVMVPGMDALGGAGTNKRTIVESSSVNFYKVLTSKSDSGKYLAQFLGLSLRNLGSVTQTLDSLEPRPRIIAW
jgi:hypothetical protein